ncbi:tesmin TSO1-like CXC domain protein (macronuclear) [Tetrahymena thermophila SB210]|uniref:Tesmin TSO1-like CXC domain protein n=1 Tax=Tetrahymena thermophila (strain SB210) TaxID=312017 RepID=Q22UZ1_TETTS|nr:tesmin TSO1-like CXC domain protein [Tetrahymena thermophila SB210]EAR89157.2 tesmin TSO1-like CXC domain protein [Tetrahymena thermophila SB210]|eukprot:XP_001009402.2 tesmin TSO1-like CXC domain protein [Tetrahymena thermophila SB210]
MNNSIQNSQANSSTQNTVSNLFQVESIPILRSADLNTCFSKGFSTSFKPVSPLNSTGSNIIKPVAVKRTSSQASTPLAGLQNLLSFSSLLNNTSKKTDLQQTTQDYEKENMSNATLSYQLMKELQHQLQLELSQQSQSTPLSSSTIGNQMNEQSIASNSSPLFQFFSQTECNNNQNLLSGATNFNNQLLNKNSPCLQAAQKPIAEEQEEATSPCVVKKRKVQKKSQVSSQNLNEQKTEEMESECSNDQNKSQISASLVNLQQEQVEEVKIIQKKSKVEGKKRQKKSKKSSQSLEEQQSNQIDFNKSDSQKESLTDTNQEDSNKKGDSPLPSQQEVNNQKEDQSNENQSDEEEGDDDEEDMEQQSAEGKPHKQSLSQQQQKLLMQIGENQGNGSNKKTRICNCKKTKCLKLYCDCFAAGEFCGAECNCCECSNTVANKEARNKIVEGLLEKNPFAFNVKDIEIEEPSQLSLKAQKKLASKKGCNCRRSGCLKKYCQCYQDGLQCGEHCKCNGCENCEKPAKKLFLAEQNSLSLQSQNSTPNNNNNTNSFNTQSLLINNNLSLSKQNSLNFNENQNKQFQASVQYNNQLNTQQNTSKLNKANNNFLLNQVNTTFNNNNYSNNNNNNNNNNKSSSNNQHNLLDESAQQLVLTQILSSMVAQQTSILNNPLIQLATLQASLQSVLMPQQQQQTQQNSFESSIESLLLQAAAVAASNSLKDTSKLNKKYE